MKAWALLLTVIALGLAIAALALRPPSPLAATAAAQRFAAARALPDIATIAQRPHPIRSPEQARVRDYLFGRMVDLGLAPRLRPVDSDQGSLFNLLGVLPGADRMRPAVLLMAHFDSVPAGPGAADDGAGVAAVLETVRALKAAGPRKRDVMVLLTDGEEPGLYGAKAFFSADPLRGHVGVVINLEARGDRGRAVMFETHREGGALIAFLTDRGALSGASSLMPDLYRRLPNSTDLTEALKRGYAGMNLAFFGGFDAYHRPSDTPDRLELGSLQSMGDQALAATTALASAPALPGRAPDPVYADILGGPILRYPVAAGWALLVVAVAGLAIAAAHALIEKQASVLGLAASGLSAMGLMIGLVFMMSTNGLLRAWLAHGRLDPLLRHPGDVLAGNAGVACGGVLIWFWLGRRAMTAASLRLGALTALALLAIALQTFAALDAFIMAWPLALTAVAVVLQARFDGEPLAAAPIILLAMAQLSYWLCLIFTLEGQVAPVVLAPFFALMAIALLPLAPPSARGAGWAGAVGLAAGLAASAFAIRA